MYFLQFFFYFAHFLLNFITIYIMMKLFLDAEMKSDPEAGVRELFLPFRCFCTRKDVSFIYFILFN